MSLSETGQNAWGTFNSEYGSVRIAEIDNLSSVIAARNSEEGYVGMFGDKLIITPVSKRNGVLTQTQKLNQKRGRDVGLATENGIWLFLEKAIREKEHWDNIFVYSDMQAGHGGLYGIRPEDYAAIGARIGGRYIDVNMLVKLYRQLVNPRVNVFCIQTAGYSNVLVPEYGYRTAVLYGWTGKELLFADAMNRIWDELETRGPEKQ